MQYLKKIAISKDYVKKFEPKFRSIVKLADQKNDVGYGKGLARLQTEMEEYLIEKIDLEVKKERQRLIKLINLARGNWSKITKS